MVRGLSSGTRVFEYIENRPSMRLAGGLRIDRGSLEGRIEFKGVSFSYPTRADQVLISPVNLCLTLFFNIV